MLFDPLILIQQPLAVLATLAIILFGKSVAALFLVRLFGHSQRTALTIAASLAQIGEFAFILAGLGMALNLLPQAGQKPGTGRGDPVDYAQPGTVRTTGEISGEDRNAGRADAGRGNRRREADPSGYLQPCATGGLRSCRQPAGEKLLASDIPLVVIETSRTRVDELRERGVRAVLGNAANEEIMQLAHLECAKWLILTIPNGYEAGEIVASARAKNPDIEIIARAHYDDEVAYITERGANQVVMGEREIARTMLELLETPPAVRW